MKTKCFNLKSRLSEEEWRSTEPKLLERRRQRWAGEPWHLLLLLLHCVLWGPRSAQHLPGEFRADSSCWLLSCWLQSASVTTRVTPNATLNLHHASLLLASRILTVVRFFGIFQKIWNGASWNTSLLWNICDSKLFFCSLLLHLVNWWKVNNHYPYFLLAFWWEWRSQP